MSARRVVIAQRLIALALILFARTASAQGARWTLKETLRIGGAEAGPASFNQVRAVDVDAKGRILVMDRQTQDIRMFAPDGKHLRTIGGQGAGPGALKKREAMMT